ncbi:GNAT family N-acetyltransferase [Desulfomicrobium sp. ZS1]|uniref:GNAT family N-acetyltransferase n=1 Tax=Desulfomicrobium sp. ZS1 TaxID=2952228 RepID=UPI0020B37966|nr:N-acetyltransferase [Desulfomicrobium sp. ZS1]UTF50157.1 GNAT family N-acetyltransferase [Desulfomicrobium sp. ZS1]
MASERTSRPEVTVREMELDDLAPVYHLGERLFTCDLYPFLYRTWDEWEVVGHYNTDPEFSLVAEVGDALAGFIIGTLISKASWTYGYIVWLGVDRAFHSTGVAQKLYDKLVERMVEAGARYLIADTDPSNTAALKFFGKKGFKEEREHVVLSLNLSRNERYRAVLEKHGNGHGEADLKKSKRSSAALKKGKEKPLCGATILEPEL